MYHSNGSCPLHLSLSLLPLCVSRASRDTGTRARRRVTVSLRLRHSRTPPHKGPERAHIPVCCCIACQSRDGTWVEATSPVVTTGIIRVSSHQSQNTDVPHTPRELDARGLVNWMPSLACHIQAKALRYHYFHGKGQLAHSNAPFECAFLLSLPFTGGQEEIWEMLNTKGKGYIYMGTRGTCTWVPK